MGGSRITTEEERGALGVSRAPGETEAKRPRVDGSVGDDALQHPLHNGHQRLKPLMCVCVCVFFNLVSTAVKKLLVDSLDHECNQDVRLEVCLL